MTAMNTESLTGALQIYPGRAVPRNLHSTRRNWLAMLAAGRKATDLPLLLTGLYNLCDQSHQACAELALAAATGGHIDPARNARAVQLETAREHTRRIALDWPRLLLDANASQTAADPAWQQSFRRCPLFGSSAQLPDAHEPRESHENHEPHGNHENNTSDQASSDPLATVRQWLSKDWLGVDAAHWLHRWEQDGGRWLQQWAAQTSTGLAQLVAATLRTAPSLAAHASTHNATNALAWTDATAPALFTRLASELLNSEQFALEPLLEGAPAQTGTWTRHYSRETPARLPHELLGARLADLVRLCLPDATQRSGAGWLTSGALRTGPHQAIAWLEMARGVLVHAVELDTDDPATATVLRCQVIAPTEWNFHAGGAVADYLAHLDPAAPATPRHVNLLMAAFDPCLPFQITPATAQNAVGSTDHSVGKSGTYSGGQHA